MYRWINQRLFSITWLTSQATSQFSWTWQQLYTIFNDNTYTTRMCCAFNSNNKLSGKITSTRTREIPPSLGLCNKRIWQLNIKWLPLELTNTQQGHSQCRTLLAVNEHKLWQDMGIQMAQETGHCICGIATAHSSIEQRASHRSHLYWRINVYGSKTPYLLHRTHSNLHICFLFDFHWCIFMPCAILWTTIQVLCKSH